RTTFANSPRKRLSRDSLDRLLAGGVDVQHDQRIGICEGRGEFIHQVASPGVAMRLEDDVNLEVSALARSSQRGTNFRWVMCVIVDDGYADSLTAKLETTVNAAESLKRFTDIGHGNIESNTDGNSSARVESVVQPRDVQVEFAEVFISELYRKIISTRGSF